MALRKYPHETTVSIPMLMKGRMEFAQIDVVVPCRLDSTGAIFLGGEAMRMIDKAKRDFETTQNKKA